MIKKITWKQIDVKKENLARFLTANNLQPGKFVLAWTPFSDKITVAYVEKEEDY